MTTDQEPRLIQAQDGSVSVAAIAFECPHCGHQILVRALRGIDAITTCPNCSNSIEIPDVPCFYQCGGVYKKCGGELRSEKVPDRFADWETTCLKCGRVKNQWAKAGSTCETIACTNCNRELPPARVLPEL
jgi:transcription elongation factor Elf1